MSRPLGIRGTTAPSITAVVITLNEEHNIKECLESLAWVDEIIVIDAESRDQTVPRAKMFTKSVFVKPWAGYGPQKNFGIDQATGEWILIVDADERVTGALRKEILKIPWAELGDEIVGFELPRRNFFYGRWIQGGGMYPDPQLRLFRRSAGRYDDTALHERLQLMGKTVPLRKPLDHYSMPTIDAHVQKMIRYTTLGATEKLKSRSRVGVVDLGANHLGTFFKTYVIRGSFRDGIQGLIVAIFAGMHTFVKYVKVWEQLHLKK